MSEEQAAYEVEELTTIVSDTGRFAIVPEWVLMGALSKAALRLYTVLAFHADRGTGASHLLRKTLAKECGCSVRTIARALLELVAVGALQVKHRKPKGKKNLLSSVYTVIRARPATGGDKTVPTPQATGVLGGRDTRGLENQSQLEPDEDSVSLQEKSSSSGRDEDDLPHFLRTVEDLYTGLPHGLRSPLTKPAAYFRSVRENGSVIPRFRPLEALQAAELIQHALDPLLLKLKFPHPKEVAGLDDLHDLLWGHPKLAAQHGGLRFLHLRACVGQFVGEDEDEEGNKLNPDTVLTRLARQPDKLRQVIDLSNP